jgi:hypothetical protein
MSRRKVSKLSKFGKPKLFPGALSSYVRHRKMDSKFSASRIRASQARLDFFACAGPFLTRVRDDGTRSVCDYKEIASDGIDNPAGFSKDRDNYWLTHAHKGLARDDDTTVEEEKDDDLPTVEGAEEEKEDDAEVCMGGEGADDPDKEDEQEQDDEWEAEQLQGAAAREGRAATDAEGGGATDAGDGAVRDVEEYARNLYEQLMRDESEEEAPDGEEMPSGEALLAQGVRVPV